MAPIRMWDRCAAALSFLALLLASEAVAQVAWDAPLFVPPRPPAGTGIYVADTAGGAVGALVGWRSESLGRELGWRVGVADGHRDQDLSGYAGVDLSGPIQRLSNDLPFEVAWVAGGGVSVGDRAVLSIPLGISLGSTVAGSESIRLTPYLAPRITADAIFGGDGENDVFDLGFSLDLGLDMAFQSDWMARLGLTVGDRDAVAFGLVF